VMGVMPTFPLMAASHTGKYNMQALYKFYEVVTIASNKPSLKEINGQEAAVMGMAENDNGQWCYAVNILDSDDGWDVMESDLQPTGRMMSREDFYDGELVKVEVDSRQVRVLLKIRIKGV